MPPTKKDTTSKALKEKNKEMDSFAVLGLEHGAEEAEVKKAYKSLAKRWILFLWDCTLDLSSEGWALKTPSSNLKGF